MKTDLPAQEEYYRLTRARELWEKVVRLGKRSTAGSVLAVLAFVVFIGPCAWWVLGVSSFVWGSRGVLFTAVLMTLLSGC
jgi:hypothetical protein